MIEGLEQFMANPHFRKIIENAPTRACRAWIEKSLVYGTYCGNDPGNPKTAWEKDLTAGDWKYILRTMGSNTRLEPKCRKRIAELETGQDPSA